MLGEAGGRCACGAGERLAGERGGEDDGGGGELDEEWDGAGTVHVWTEQRGAPVIRRCRDDELAAIGAIVNAAAVAYRGVIPDDRWHEPYMPAPSWRREIAAGVEFWGYEDDGELIGVMGIQPVQDVS